jgi:hypothetical protein
MKCSVFGLTEICTVREIPRGTRKFAARCAAFSVNLYLAISANLLGHPVDDVIGVVHSRSIQEIVRYTELQVIHTWFSWHLYSHTENKRRRGFIPAGFLFTHVSNPLS